VRVSGIENSIELINSLVMECVPLRGAHSKDADRGYSAQSIFNAWRQLLNFMESAVETLLQDLRYASRTLRKSPGFTVTAILSLALGIGANTAIFSLIDAVMLRSLPVKDPEQLVLFGRSFPYPRFEQFRDHNEVFSATAAVCALDQVKVRGGLLAATDSGDSNERSSGRLVSGSYFPLLGVPAIVGRTLTAEEDTIPGGHPVAVISYNFWRRRFGLDQGIIGKTIHLGAGRLVWGASVGGEDPPTARKADAEGAPFTIIGVTPSWFSGETVGDGPDFWIPMMMQAQVMPGREWLSRRNVGWVRIIGRMRPGLSLEKAAASINVLFHQLLTQDLGSKITEEQRRIIRDMRINLLPGGRGFTREEHGKNSIASLNEFSGSLLILMAVVGAVLLIACANVANLLVARAAARRKEIAVRLALGASRLRLLWQLLAESLLLALLGGALGILLAAWGSSLLVRLVSDFVFSGPVTITFRPDMRILAFTTAISLVTGLLFGMAPAFQSARIDLNSILKADAWGTGDGRPTLRKALVVFQVVVSLLLLIGATLFVRTLQNLQGVSVGYERENLLLVRIDPLTGGYKGAEISRLAEELRGRFAGLPGVRAVTFSENGLFSGPESAGPIQIEGYAPQAAGEQVARFDQVGPQYFAAVGIPLLLGRDFAAQDAGNAPPVAVINEAMARYYFQGTSPIGKKIFWLPKNREGFEIIGVARNVQDHSLRWQQIRRFYVPFHQPIERISSVIFEVRTQGNSAGTVDAIRREIRTVDPALPVLSIQTLEGLIDRFLLRERLVTCLSSFFGILALTLAAVGLYGVMSYSVTRRTIEIGIRAALGARATAIIWLVLRESLRMVLLGIAIGVPVALAATRLISSQLYGLGPNDPWVIGLAMILILAVSGLAGYLPARRAARVDPMVALRSE
jgi:predicted permease